MIALLVAAFAQDPAPAPEPAPANGPGSERKPYVAPATTGPGSGPVAFEKLPFEGEAYRAEQELGMAPELAHEIRAGLHLLYLRRYEDARAHFVEVEKKFPGTGLAPVADTLVWQALMLENFDFRFDKQYWVSSRNARKELTAALATPGNDGWERFLMAGISGIESIHTMRQSHYLQALALAFEAMDHIEKARAISPTFTDLKLADGMYNYWRTVVTKSAPILPDFGDHRAEGIAQMQEVEKTGVFLAPPATLALAFTWSEEGDHKAALTSCLRNYREYPDNVINNLVMGSTHVATKKYDSALRVFDEILADDPKNKRARYWRGLTYQQSGKLPEAEADYLAYLGFDYMEPYQRAQAHYRLGQVYYRQKKYAEAEAQLQTAIKIDGNKGAKAQLEKMKQARKEGKITW